MTNVEYVKDLERNMRLREQASCLPLDLPSNVGQLIAQIRPSIKPISCANENQLVERPNGTAIRSQFYFWMNDCLPLVGILSLFN